MGAGDYRTGETALELRFQNCRIVIDFSFPAMLAILFLQADAGLLKQAFLVCLIHELGHGLAMCLTESGIREIRFYASGIRMKTKACLLSDGKLLAIYLSGPLMNLICAVLFRNVSPLTAVLHLGMGVFNLLPYRILDGGAVLETFLENRPVCLKIRSIFCIILSAVSVSCLYCLKIQNPSLYLTAVYLAFSEFAVDKSPSL